MADSQPLSVTSHTESVGESIIIGLTPRDVQQFIKGLVNLNTTLRRQLAAVNQDLAERRNADNASTESDVHSPIQATGQSDSYLRADQSLRQPSTLASTLSNTAAPVQVESEAAEIFGSALEVWQQSFPRFESTPRAPAGQQLDGYLRWELEQSRNQYNELEELYNRLSGMHFTTVRRHNEQKDRYRQQLASFQNDAAVACRERDESRQQLASFQNDAAVACRERDESRAAQQRLQSEIDDLKGHMERHLENLRTQQEQVATLKKENLRLNNENEKNVRTLAALKNENDEKVKRIAALNNENEENTKRITELDTLRKEYQRLLTEDNERKRLLATITGERDKLTGDYSELKEQAMSETSSLSEQLKAVQDSKDELQLAYKQLVKETERLEQELNAAKMKFEHLPSDAKLTSRETTQLKRRIRELEHKVEEVLKSKAELLVMLQDSMRKEDKIELKNQLEDVRAMLKVSEDLARMRGETIENMKREHSRNVESSETYRTLRQKCDTYEKSLDVVRNDLEKESATVKELRQSIETMQSAIEEITNERDSLRLIIMRQRHNLPPVVSMSGSASEANTGKSAGAAAGAAAAAATLPATFAQPLRLEVTADAGSPRARTGTRQSAVQTPTNIRLPASTQPLSVRAVPPMIYRCRYCNAEHPDYDSRFVHEKDCPKSPSDD